MFAADSKVTTRGIVGLEENGTPRWQDQTYDNAYKIVHDRSQKLMVMVAGDANIGQISATDFIATKSLNLDGDNATQDLLVASLAKEMFHEIEMQWSGTNTPPEQWPGPILLLSAPSSDGKRPRVWRIALYQGKAEVQEIQKEPNIRLEGSYNEIFPLLYGFESSVLTAVAKDLEIDIEDVWKSLQNVQVLKPINKLNLYTMPIQDAMDFAVFLAKCQVEMERFLPGSPVCGGPIDVMVLQMAPESRIQSYPGKTIHHPHGTI